MPELHLSHWDDEDVYVPAEHVEELEMYQVSAVRSLYESYNAKFKGKLISYPAGFNAAIILRALISAISKRLKLPILVLCEDENVTLWRYQLSKLVDVKVFIFGHKTIEFNAQYQSILICSLQKLKDLQSVGVTEWSIVVTENIETVVTKLVFKRIGDAQFRVALTKTDFMETEDLKLFWHILNWCNPSYFGKLNEFADAHKQHCDNLRDPYDDVWHRIDWDLPDTHLIEDTEYKKRIETHSSNVKSSTSTGGNIKRKSTNNYNTKNNGSKSNKQTSTKRIKTTNDLDLTALLDEDSWIENFMKEMDIPENPLLVDESVQETDGGEEEKRQESFEEYPILDAIINGNPLKNAVEKYTFNILGRSQDEDDFYPFSEGNRTENIIVADRDVSSLKSTDPNDVLKILFGDQAVLVSEYKSVIFPTSF